jgi:WD40 repeat protein
LKQLNVDEEKIENAITLAIEYKNKLNKERNKINEFISNHKYLKYEKNPNALNFNLLGSLKISEIYKPIGSENTVHQNAETYLYNEFKILTGHSSGVSAMAYLVNADLLATCSYDKTIKLWNLKSNGELKKTFKGHTSCISSIVVLPSGDIATCSWDTTIKIWNTNTGEVKLTLSAHNAKVICLAVLSNGDLCSGSWDRRIRIWNTATGKLKLTLTGHSLSVVTLASLANEELASGSEDFNIKIWNTVTGDLRTTLVGHSSVVRALIGLPDGDLASGSWDK